MTLPVHRPEPGLLAELAAGGGAPVVRWLTGVRRSRTMLLLRAVRDLAVGHREGPTARAGYAALAHVHRVAPAAAEALIASPVVGSWAARTATALDRGSDDAAPGWIAVVAATAALRGGVPLELALPADGRGHLHFPGLGTAELPAPVPEVCFRSHGTGGPCAADLHGDTGSGRHGVRLPHELGLPSPGWRPAQRIEARYGGLVLNVALGGLDARPPADLPVTWWRDRLTAGWRLLVRHHRTVAAEVGAGIQLVAPLADAEGALRSVTYRDAFGCVLMTPPPDARWVALTFAHEIQHAKLSVLTDLVALTEPNRQADFYAPWRDDSRPVAGLLHGLYAHVGVTGFWRRQQRHEATGADRFHAQVEFVRWREACGLAADTLRGSGLLTTYGVRFVAALEDTVHRWAGETMPAAVVTAARAEADRHRNRWLATCGPPAGESR